MFALAAPCLVDGKPLESASFPGFGREHVPHILALHAPLDIMVHIPIVDWSAFNEFSTSNCVPHQTLQLLLIHDFVHFFEQQLLIVIHRILVLLAFDPVAHGQRLG